ncbi:hypothetical protein [Alloscardovia omnicolens]|uniref:hypothetical protein n=1 Tax=Alloscardovia omnicolens TaxID=419015 RepID=UPI00069F13DC|nr:hypothetical protein [Alloscardovia omnicolens]
MLNARLRAGDLFTYLNPEATKQAIVPAFNNQIESYNAGLRAMLRTHRDWLLLHRIKACMWWCYMHTQCPLPAAQLIQIMPADQHITNMYTQLAIHHSEREHAQRQHYDQAISWADLTWSSQKSTHSTNNNPPTTFVV